MLCRQITFTTENTESTEILKGFLRGKTVSVKNELQPSAQIARQKSNLQIAPKSLELVR